MDFPFFGNYWNYPSHHWSGAETPAAMNPHRWAGVETPAMNPHHWAEVETPAMNRRASRESRRNRTEVESPVMNRQTRSQFPESPRTGMEMPTARNQPRTQLPKSASKVVDIPVRFIGSEKMKSTAAVKIQKVFRGLLVRKSVKKIDAIRKEVDEIENRVSEKEMILMMKRDAKERLKMNEMLMALLLRLDSIRGVDSGVRDFRKSVIKKAIMLQERVDDIVSGDIEMVETRETMEMQEEEEHCNTGDCEPVMEEAGDQASELQQVLVECAPDDCETAVQTQDQVSELQHVLVECAPDDCETAVQTQDQASELQQDPADDCETAVQTQNQASELQQVPVDDCETAVQTQDQASELQQVLVEYGADDCETAVQTQDKLNNVAEAEKLEEDEEDLMDFQQQPELVQAEDQGGAENKAVEENSNNNRDLMERMIEGNDMLMSLVTELCERQESQSRLLSSLSQRVENLQKASRAEKSKRKKKRNANINSSNVKHVI